MSIKPVAWHTEDHTDDCSATTYDESVAIRWDMKGWPVTPMYYAIPDTHRVVSVELLEKCVGQLLYGAKAHQDLNDEVGNPSRIAPGRIACETLSDELSAIIDNTPQ